MKRAITRRASGTGQLWLVTVTLAIAVFLSACSESETTRCGTDLVGNPSCTTETENEAWEWITDNWIWILLGGIALAALAVEQWDKRVGRPPSNPGRRAVPPSPDRKPNALTISDTPRKALLPFDMFVLASDVRPGDYVVLGSGSSERRPKVVAIHTEPGQATVVGIVLEDGSTTTVLGSQRVHIERSQ